MSLLTSADKYFVDHKCKEECIAMCDFCGNHYCQFADQDSEDSGNKVISEGKTQIICGKCYVENFTECAFCSDAIELTDDDALFLHTSNPYQSSKEFLACSKCVIKKTESGEYKAVL